MNFEDIVHVIASQRLLKPSNSLVKSSLVPRLHLRHLQIRPHSETVSRPYASSDCMRRVLITRKKKDYPAKS